MSTKSLWFKAVLSGRGIVNYDGKDAKWAAKKYFSEYFGALKHDNVKIAKHAITKTTDNDGKAVYQMRVKISSACIRHAIFEADQPYHNPAILHAPQVLVKAISSVAGLVRGYMFESKGGVGIKRKSPLLVTDAVQTNNAVSSFDLGTQMCPKDIKESSDDASGLSLHYKECICEVIYELEGAIDLNLLQFLSLSEMYDRLVVDPNYLREYRVGLEATLGSPVVERGFYIYKTATNGLPEEGLLLTQEQCLVLVKETLTRILSTRIIRGGGGYANIDSLKIKHINDPLTDFPSEESGYYTVKNLEDLKLKAEDVEIFYQRVDETEAAKFYTEIETADRATKAANKANKTAAKEAKAKAKESKKAIAEDVSVED